MRAHLVLCTLVIVLTGCAGGSTSTASNEAYAALVTQTENEIKLASKTGFLWLNTENILKDAQAAKDNADKARQAGDHAMADSEMSKATKLANKALKEAQLAQQQAKDNANPVASFQ